MKEAKAKVRMIRITPRKFRLVANLIRGKKVERALQILQYVPRKGSRILYKLLKSAIANAENNHEMDVDRLYIHRIFVDEGPRWKRVLPRSMGRANLIIKRTSHATIILREEEIKKISKKKENNQEEENNTGKEARSGAES